MNTASCLSLNFSKEPSFEKGRMLSYFLNLCTNGTYPPCNWRLLSLRKESVLTNRKQSLTSKTLRVVTLTHTEENGRQVFPRLDIIPWRNNCLLVMGIKITNNQIESDSPNKMLLYEKHGETPHQFLHTLFFSYFCIICL